MKKKLVYVIVGVVFISVFLSCQRRSKQLVSFVEHVRMDSCQYDKEGNILYFIQDTVAVFYTTDEISIGSDRILKKNDADVYQKIADILKEKYPAPEAYTSVCVRRFDHMIEKEHVDSCFMRKVQKTSYYTFFLSDEKIVSMIINGFLLVQPSEDIYISTEKNGVFVGELSDITFDWPIAKKKEFLDALIAKSKQKHPLCAQRSLPYKRPLYTREELLSKLK